MSVIQNYSDFIFQVWPRLNYEAHKEQSELSEQIQTVKYNLRKRKPTTGGKGSKKTKPSLQVELLEKYEKELIELNSRKKQEKSLN